jgi:hypothetical protein
VVAVSRCVCFALGTGVGILAVGTPAWADEPIFGFTYTTDLLPRDQKEVEQWATWRHQKAHGSFNEIEARSEFSYGVTDDFQLSGYLNYAWTSAYHNAVDGSTEPPEQFAVYNQVDPNARFNASKFTGISLEAIYRMMSPYTDSFGLAFYFEPTVGNDFREFELKAIVQKNFLDDRLVVAANLTWAPELRFIPADPGALPGTTAFQRHTDVETDLNWSVAVSYRFAPDWSIGWEFQNEREMAWWAIFAKSHWMGDAYYTGPTIHYGGEHFFFTLTLWEQLPFARSYDNAGVIYQGRDYDVDFEKYRTRLKLGYYF